MTDPESVSPASITWAVHRCRLGTDLHHSTVDTPVLEEVYCRVGFTDGTSGLSEVRGNGQYATGETTGRIVTALDAVRACLDDHPTVAEVLAHLMTRSHLAAMAVDVARNDALARSHGVPLYLWLGASAPVHAWPTHLPLPFSSDEAARVRTCQAVEAGFARLKIRLGQDVDTDRHRIELVREAAGESVEVIADANGGWTPEQARQMLPVLDDNDVTWIEQPVAAVQDLVDLCARPRRVRIRADESARDNADIAALAEQGAADGVHVKLEKVGTLSALVDAVSTAHAHGLDVALGQMDQSRLGCAVTAHLAAGLGIVEAELWGCADILDDAAGPLDCVDGSVVLPQAPGIGVDVHLPEWREVGTWS